MIHATSADGAQFTVRARIGTHWGLTARQALAELDQLARLSIAAEILAANGQPLSNAALQRLNAERFA